jgi:CTP:molybdopterin cytidylyltransferase MocA
MAPASPYVTGLVLAAGGSKRLGQPKQLLPYGETTLLGPALGAVDPRADVLVVMLGDQPGVETATVMKLLRSAATPRSRSAPTPTAAAIRSRSRAARSPTWRRYTATRRSGS